MSGRGSVALRATPDIASIRIDLGGWTVASMNEPPWTAEVDFGPEIIPQELTAVGYDHNGAEIARTSQVVNLPRPAAELEIVLSAKDGIPSAAQLVGRHFMHAPAARAELTIDGKVVPVGGDMRAALPEVNWDRPHVLAAAMTFADGKTARRETVLQGGIGEAVSSELTPVLVTGVPTNPRNLEGCFSADGSPLRASAVDRANALVVLVKDPDAQDVISRIHPVSAARVAGWLDSKDLRNDLQLDHDATEQIIWPVASEFAAINEPTFFLFNFSAATPALSGGMTWLLTQSIAGAVLIGDEPRRFADAVAVAGLKTLETGQRRAVVLLLNRRADASRFSPAVVRRYLQRIGVPLFVWSVEPPRAADLRNWGEVTDISSRSSLARAFAKLNDTILAQRVAWAATDRLTALRIKIDPRCGFEPVARADERTGGRNSSAPGGT